MTTIRPERSPQPDRPGRYLATGLAGFLLFALGALSWLSTLCARSIRPPRSFRAAVERSERCRLSGGDHGHHH